ncbi:MAG: RidA family protein [Dehalococcoidia bacterium]|nr:RidA family protein [Dehalococcoidia bacterium]
MADRKKVFSVSPYEDVIGFSRAVRVGDLVFVSGTVAWGPDGKLVGAGDVYAQAKQTLANIEGYLREAGATLKDVVRTRIYLTDIGRWQEVARAHREAFGGVRPASSMLEISGLAEPEMLVEIEAVAVLSAAERKP